MTATEAIEALVALSKNDPDIPVIARSDLGGDNRSISLERVALGGPGYGYAIAFAFAEEPTACENCDDAESARSDAEEEADELREEISELKDRIKELEDE